ncbi:MAG TPA: cytochrome c biogenesis protein CcsA [Verrucomicrobiae bacterium]|nr:cytochrome c biogenesis protein CcsA [Verrucomicrobiae bacterium]
MLLSDRQAFGIAVVLYALSAVYAILLLRRGFREDNWINYLLLLGASVFHTGAMLQRSLPLQRCPINNLYEAMLFIGWTIVTSYVLVGFWSKLRFLGAFASPLLLAIGVFALMPGLDQPYDKEPNFSGDWLSLHAALILLSYGAFGLSCVAAAMYLTQEHDLKFNKMRAVISLMPPIQRLELATGRLLLTGFLLLTAGLAIGVFTLKETHGVYLMRDLKIFWSGLVWVGCLGLLVSRWWFAQRGRRLAWGVVGMFGFVLLTFWGSNLLSGIHNPDLHPVPVAGRP